MTTTLLIFTSIAIVAWCVAELVDFLSGYIDRYAKSQPKRRERR